MKFMPTLAGLATAAVLAGCNQPVEPKQPGASDGVGNNMAGMAMPAEMKHGTGTGTVTAIDEKAGTITLDHGEVVELEWPAMKMGFAANPEALKGISVGDKVEFEIDWNGQTGKVTKITKAAN